MTRPVGPNLHLLVPATWVAAVLATQAWLPWSRGIQDQFATDTISYEQIARAAPGLPSGPLPQQHAERLSIHWVLGAVSDLTGAGLHELYRATSIAFFLAIAAVLTMTLRRLRLDLCAQTVALGVVIASPYAVRYLLAAPGMVADELFLLGVSVALLGLAGAGDSIVVAGLLLAVAGRQTAVPVAVVAASVLAARGRRRAAVGACLGPLALYAGLHSSRADFRVATWAAPRASRRRWEIRSSSRTISAGQVLDCSCRSS